MSKMFTKTKKAARKAMALAMAFALCATTAWVNPMTAKADEPQKATASVEITAKVLFVNGGGPEAELTDGSCSLGDGTLTIKKADNSEAAITKEVKTEKDPQDQDAETT